MNGSPADDGALQLANSINTCRTTEGNTRMSLRSEFISYRSEVYIRRFTAKESAQYWTTKKTEGKYPRNGKLARLFLFVPASAIP